MKAVLLLADAAQAVAGKLYILGGGWTHQWGATPFAIAAYIQVPWSEATKKHTWKLELLDADGQPVPAPTVSGGSEALVIEDSFCTGISPIVRQGTPTAAVLSVTVGPLPLEPGRYVWRLSIDGKSDEDWSLGFERLDPPGQPGEQAA